MRLQDELNAANVARIHTTLIEYLKQGGEAPVIPSTALWQTIEHNHRCNIALWDEEDQARRLDVPDSAIAISKRLIDGHNQRRNDAIEIIDEHVLAMLPKMHESARLHSETIGALIDRLSILSLKIYHMGLQTLRADVDEAHLKMSSERLLRLKEQRADLVGCLEALIHGCLDGTLRFKIYRQFKMYNDRRFNPGLSASK